MGERHLRRLLAEFSAHYHRERNQHGLENELIDYLPAQPTVPFAVVSESAEFSVITIVPRRK